MKKSATDLIRFWDSGEGRPFKGSLIDWPSYDGDGEQPPADLGCMCAQGQVLHLIGGWSPQRLADAEQGNADVETAKLLNISHAHSVLLRTVNDNEDGAPSSVLTNPAKVLGGKAQTILAFWLALDRFTPKQWAAARAAARAAAGDAAWAAARAANEIQGAALMRERGQAFYFLPNIGFANPEAIPPLPSGYGVTG